MDPSFLARGKRDEGMICRLCAVAPDGKTMREAGVGFRAAGSAGAARRRRNRQQISIARSINSLEARSRAPRGSKQRRMASGWGIARVRRSFRRRHKFD